MDFLLFLLGTDAPLEGHWERLDDAFAGCVVRIEKQENATAARIVALPPAMARAGWQPGELKWHSITPDARSRWRLRDLRKHFDTQTQSVVRVDFQDYFLFLAPGGRLRLHTDAFPLFPSQRWRLIAS